MHTSILPVLLRRLFLWLPALVLASGCSVSPSLGPNGLSRGEQDIQNLRSSNEVLKKALGNMGRERDRYKERYLAGEDELRTATTMTEYFEARHRVNLEFVRRAEESSQEAVASAQRSGSEAKEASTMRRQLESQINDLKRRVNTGNEQNHQLTVQLASMTRERDLLEEKQENLDQSLSQHQVSMRSQLAAKNEEVETLRNQVNRLKNQLVVLEEEKDEAVASFVPSGTSVTPPRPPEFVEPPAAPEYLVMWWKQSVNELRRGEFNEENKLLLGLVGSGAILLCMVFFFMVRARLLRRRLRKTAAAVAQKTAPLRASEVSPPPVGVSRERMAATVQMPTPPRPAAQPARPAAQPVPQPVPASGGSFSDQLEGILGDGGDDSATVMIGPGSSSPAPRKAPSVGGPQVNDAELLNDLQRAIQEKFKELKD